LFFAITEAHRARSIVVRGALTLGGMQSHALVLLFRHSCPACAQREQE
jgi:hypothetical protein